MAAIFNKFRSSSDAVHSSEPPAELVHHLSQPSPKPSTFSPPTIHAPADDGSSQHLRNRRSSTSPNSRTGGGGSRSSSRVRTASFGNRTAGPQPFPTPFHSFRLNPTSTKNQVNALKFVDRIDSLLYLGHSGAVILEAIPACMTNPESQAWYNKVQTAELHKPTTIEDFRLRLITDHVWAYEQSRITSRYQSRTSTRKDPYLESAEFKLHLGYIRETVRLEESMAQRDKRIALLQSEMEQSQSREGQFQMTIANLQNDLVQKEGGEVVPVEKRTGDLLNNMREMDESKLRIKALEQERGHLQQRLGSMQMRINDLDTQNTQLQSTASSLQPLRNRLVEFEGQVAQLQAIANAVEPLRTRVSELEAQNSQLRQSNTANASRSTPSPVLERDAHQLRQQLQNLVNELNNRESRIYDLENKVQTQQILLDAKGTNTKSPPYPMGPAGSVVHEATRSMDSAFDGMNLSNANLELIIEQKDATIYEMHAKLGSLTDEALNRIQRVFQVEQSLLEVQTLLRNRDVQIRYLEQRLQTLGHNKDCNCAECARTSTKHHSQSVSSISDTVSNSHRSSTWDRESIGTGTTTPRTLSSGAHSRFLDIKFKYVSQPSFVSSQAAPQVHQLLENGLSIIHPGAEYKLLWESIVRALVETLGDHSVIAVLTQHMRLCFREKEGDHLKGFVVADVWTEVWREVTGIDVACDF